MSANIRYPCTVCKRTFTANFTLRRHVQLCHPGATLPAVRRGRKPKNDNRVKCCRCGETLTNKKALYYHRKQKHGSAGRHIRYERQKCSMEFETEAGEHSFVCYTVSTDCHILSVKCIYKYSDSTVAYVTG